MTNFTGYCIQDDCGFLRYSTYAVSAQHAWNRLNCKVASPEDIKNFEDRGYVCLEIEGQIYPRKSKEVAT